MEVRTDGDEQRVDSGRVVHPLLLTQMMQTDNLHPQLLSYKPILAASEDSTSTASGDSTSTESSGPSGSVFAVLCFGFPLDSTTHRELLSDLAEENVEIF